MRSSSPSFSFSVPPLEVVFGLWAPENRAGGLLVRGVYLNLWYSWCALNCLTRWKRRRLWDYVSCWSLCIGFGSFSANSHGIQFDCRLHILYFFPFGHTPGGVIVTETGYWEREKQCGRVAMWTWCHRKGQGQNWKPDGAGITLLPAMRWQDILTWDRKRAFWRNSWQSDKGNPHHPCHVDCRNYFSFSLASTVQSCGRAHLFLLKYVPCDEGRAVCIRRNRDPLPSHFRAQSKPWLLLLESG